MEFWGSVLVPHLGRLGIGWSNRFVVLTWFPLNVRTRNKRCLCSLLSWVAASALLYGWLLGVLGVGRDPEARSGHEPPGNSTGVFVFVCVFFVFRARVPIPQADGGATARIVKCRRVEGLLLQAVATDALPFAGPTARRSHCQWQSINAPAALTKTQHTSLAPARSGHSAPLLD